MSAYDQSLRFGSLFFLRRGPASEEGAAGGEPVVAGRHYFRLWLSSVCLIADTTAEALFPCVFNALMMPLDGRVGFLTSVVSGERLGEEDNVLFTSAGSVHAAKFFHPDLKLTPLVPFDGYPFVIETYMVRGSVPLEDLDEASRQSAALTEKGLRQSLESFDSLAGLISRVTRPYRERRLVSGGWLEREAGGAALREGYLTFIDAEAAEIDARRLWVGDDQILYGETPGGAAPFLTHSYALLRIERLTEHDDWNSLTHVQAPYARAVKLLRAGRMAEAAVSYREAVDAAASAVELTSEVDRPRLVLQLEQDFELARENPAQYAFDEFDPSLDSVMRGAMSPAEAIEQRIVRKLRRRQWAEKVDLEKRVRDEWGARELHMVAERDRDELARLKKELARAKKDLQERADLLKLSKTLGSDGVAAYTPGMARFYMALEGDGAKGNSVQYGAEVDLVFNYALPPPSVLVLLRGEGLEKARMTDAVLQIAVLPKGLAFRESDEAWVKEARFEGGALVAPVRFQLRAAGEQEAGRAAGAGFHVLISMRSIMLYEFSLPVTLVRSVAEVDAAAFVHPLDLDLDKCVRRVEQAEMALAAALGEEAR